MTEGKSEENVDAEVLAAEPERRKLKSRKLLFSVGGLVAVLILGSLGYTSVSRSNDANNLKKIQGKVAMSEKELRDVINAKHLTVYWAGPEAGDKYAFIAVKADRVFVRYLPGGVGLKDTSSKFRIIGTYSQKNAFLSTQDVGTQLGNVGFINIDGNSVFYVKTRPANVYMGIKGKDIQVEIFDPGIDQALGLSLLHGQIRKIS